MLQHKSQDVSGRNLVNFKLLRVAYAMSYSVSSCMILQWAYQSLYLIVREFHASYLKEKVWQGYGF